MYFIVKSPPGSKKVGIPFAILTCLLFALGTCQIVISTVLDEIAWMNYRNYPGGPMAWIQQNFDITANTAQDAAYVVANFLADGAMVYLDLSFNPKYITHTLHLRFTVYTSYGTAIFTF